MGKTVVNGARPDRVIIYPAVADGIGLPDFSFHKKSDENEFVLITRTQDLTLPKNKALLEKINSVNPSSVKLLLGAIWPEIAHLNIKFNVIAGRSAALKIKRTEKDFIIEAHWNLFIPYFDHIKALPFIHSEILADFTRAAFHYMAVALRHPHIMKCDLRDLVIDSYRSKPELLLASLDIFNKLNLYHIRPTRLWLNRISDANDQYYMQIDVSAAVPHVNPEFLKDVVEFVHKIVKNYAFRYVDYLWTQQYKIIFGSTSAVGMAMPQGRDIVINIHPIIGRLNWKPALYLSLGCSIMLAILKSFGRGDQLESTYLAMMKTWNRYLSFEDSGEKSSVREIYDLNQSSAEEQCRSLLEYALGQESLDLVGDFIMLMNYSSKSSLAERLNVLKESRYSKITGAYFEQLLNTVRNLNATLMRNNINYSKLIEVLRNDNFNHLQLVELLQTGCLAGRNVVDVSDWLLLRTLLYDLINAPKVFSNDYKMLLKVITKVNKSLIVYVWALGVDQDPRYEMVSSYISKLMNDIFIFNRVRIYEIVADPVECLEAEAVTGYLLNWASFSVEERQSVIEKDISHLPRVVLNLGIRSIDDVDQVIRVMRTGTSGLVGFYLYQAYRWGTINDEITEKIRSYFPALLKQAQAAIYASKAIMGAAMLLLVLAQIVSDERDGFASNIEITDSDRQIVRDLIRQCIDWDQKHFVMMVAGIAAGYMGSIDGWVLQLFDTLMGRYDGGDRVVLRSVVQFDVENLIERALITARHGNENALVKQIQLLRSKVDPVISDQANKYLRETAVQYGIRSSEVILKGKDVREFLLTLSQLMKAKNTCRSDSPALL